jgi:hypothetical protein
MANREITVGGGTLGVLQGDVQTTPGSPNVTVTGIQGIAVVSPALDFPSSGSILTLDQTGTVTGGPEWVPTTLKGILVNGVLVSTDTIITINSPGNVSVNGSPLPGS